MDQMGYPNNIVQMKASYQEGRKFSGKMGEEITTARRPDPGVPQGAVLSPQVYSIYTADIPKPDYPIDRKTMTLYADKEAIYNGR